MAKNKNKHFSFSDLQPGEKFVWFNPYNHAKPNLDQEHLVKISPRRYRDNCECIFHCAANVGVARIP
jgi:hypothetical protein